MPRGSGFISIPSSGGSGTGLTDNQAASTTVINNATITYVGTNVVRLNGASIITGLIVTANTVAAYPLLLINTGSYPLVMAASGTSHVSNGAACVIRPNSHVYLYWDNVSSIWVPSEEFPYDAKAASSTITGSGTITWTGDVFRVNSAAPVTSVIVSIGKWDAQHLVLINTGSYPITMAASGTSNVSDGVQCTIPPNRAINLYWDASNSLWIAINENPITNSGWGNPLLMTRIN